MKNLLLFSTLLLTSVGAFAQLTVKPNGTTDSFVYVNDQIVFVTKEVNLQKNSAGDTEASIYLRNDAQLIQKDPTAKNSGNGQLSVQQNTPDTNAWAYYYWCSPVGNPVNEAGTTTYIPGNTNFGLASIYEDKNATLLTGIGTKALKSANVGTKEGFTDPQLTISRRWMYIFPEPGTEAEGNYIRINATNGAEAGYGFTMKGVNAGEIGSGGVANYNQIYEFRGRPNNGTFKIPVDGPNAVPQAPNADAKMTLSGNPYPSALDLNKVFYDSQNFNTLSAIYYYDEDRTKMTHLYSGKPFGYGVWVPGGLDNTPNSQNDFPGTYVPAPFYIYNAAGGHSGTVDTGLATNGKRYAPIGQGFMLVGKTAGPNQFVYIKNEHRVFVKEDASILSVFQRSENETNLIADNTQSSSTSNPSWTSAPPVESVDYRIPQLRFRVIFDQALTREMVLAFSDQATDSYDYGMDGRSPLGMKTDAFFPVSTNSDADLQPYVINTVKYDYGKRIPLDFKLNKPTRININSVEEVKKPYDNAYVFDSEENTYKEISNSGPLGHMGAQYNLPAGLYHNRFFIVFRAPRHHHNFDTDAPKDETSPRDVVIANVSFFQNNPQQQLEVQNPEGYTIKSAAMYDMSGKMVISKRDLGDSKNLSFYTGNLSEGVYLVKLITSEDITIDYKAIVHN